MVKGQPRGIPTRDANLDLSKPRVPKRRFPVWAHRSSTHSGSHAATSRREFADRGFTMSSPSPLKTPNAETPRFQICATCPSSDRRLRSNRGIALRDFDVYAILAPANPDSPMCDGNGSSVHLRLKPLAAPSAINGTLEFGTLLDQLQSPILFLERILCSPPSSCTTETKAIPPELSINSNSFRVFSTTLPCARSSITSKRVEIF
jgi:hypothetical protein